MAAEREHQEEVPLFDTLPRSLQVKERQIRNTYDGTLGRQGIIMVLDPQRGTLRQAALVDLFNGKYTIYEHLERARWASPLGDLEPGSYEYEKLETVLEDVQAKFRVWKEGHRRAMPLREWIRHRAEGVKTPFVPGLIEETQEGIKPEPQNVEPVAKKKRPKRKTSLTQADPLVEESTGLGRQIIEMIRKSS